jgi:hypothetical protein
LTIDPTGDLTGSTTYAITFGANTISDLATTANIWVDTTFDASTWNVTTIATDVTAPSVSTFAPTNGESGVPVNTNLVVIFDEDVQAGSGNILVREVSGDAIVSTIAVTSGNVAISGAEVTIDPPSDLDQSTPYYVEIPNGAILDLSSNPFTGFSGGSTWAFTTTGPPALVGHWEFDNSGDVGEATVSDDLEAAGDAAYSASGKIGGALTLDGAGDYLRVDGSDSLASGLPTAGNSYTMAAFIQTTINAGQGIVGWGNYGTGGQVNAFRTTSAGEFGATGGILNYSWGGGVDYGEAAGGTAPGTIYDGGWHHVAVTYDGTTKRLYFDGVELGSGKNVGTLAVGAANFRIGSTNSGEFMNGLIDDVRVYDNALSQSEISTLASIPEPSAVALLGLGGLALLIRRRK